MELSKWKALSVPPKTRLDKWLMYLSNADPKEMEAIAMSEPAIRKALTAEEIFLKQDKERYLYEMREKALLDHVSAIEGAKEEGRIEGKIAAMIETAQKMLEMDMPTTDITKVTGLSEEDIRNLQRH